MDTVICLIHTQYETLEVQLGRASRTQETGGENGRGQRSDLGFKVSVLRVDRRSEGLGI